MVGILDLPLSYSIAAREAYTAKKSGNLLAHSRPVVLAEAGSRLPTDRLRDLQSPSENVPFAIMALQVCG